MKKGTRKIEIPLNDALRIVIPSAILAKEKPGEIAKTIFEGNRQNSGKNKRLDQLFKKIKKANESHNKKVQPWIDEISKIFTENIFNAVCGTFDKKHNKKARCTLIMSVLNTAIFKHIEIHFFNFQLIKKAVELEKERLIKSSGTRGYSDGARGNQTSDPVGTRGALLADIPAVEILTPKSLIIKNPARWVEVVEATIENFKMTLISEAIEKRYFLRLDVDATCSEIHIDRRTFYYWRDEIITFAALCAVQMKLIKILGGR